MSNYEGNRLAVRRYRARHLQRVRERARIAQHKRRQDPAFAEKAREFARVFYHEHKDRWAVYNGRRKAAERGPNVEDVSRLVVLELSDGACAICGGDLDPAAFHVDHILPLSAGGWHGYDNVQAAHPLCNVQKGTH